MNTDVRLKVDALHHWKVEALRRSLGADAVLAWIELLLYAGAHRFDGRLAGLTTREVGAIARFPGDAEDLIRELLELRLLDKDEEGTLSLHDWEEHNSWCAEFPERSKRNRRNAKMGASRKRVATESQPTGTRVATESAASGKPLPLPYPHKGEGKGKKAAGTPLDGVPGSTKKPGQNEESCPHCKGACSCGWRENQAAMERMNTKRRKR